jgi:hypothetical protein
MQIVDFTIAHIEQAAQIAKQNYEEERGLLPALPPIDTVPDSLPFVENGLGVAAFEGDMLVGFLCAAGQFKNAFRSTDATGVFSPMAVNGTIGANRANIYARMYQAVGEKWARAGAASHGICLYAHDTETQQQFFRYGFGLRCVDAIRVMDEIDALPCAGCEFTELAPDELPLILSLDHMLDAHMASCPTFILRPSDTQGSFFKKIEHFQSVFFVVKYDGEIVAYAREGGQIALTATKN